MRKFLLLGIVALLAACTDNPLDTSTSPGELDKLPIKISVEQTRANDTSFEEGDQLGLYVVNQTSSSENHLADSGNHVDNMRFTLSSDWTPDEDVFWADRKTKGNLYAYYPYGYPSNVNSYAFSVKADQSNEANYWASDFLWGKRSNVAPTADVVNIEMQHLFSNALIYIVASEGITEEELAAANIEVKICNVKRYASINLATGVATASGSTSEITPWNVGEYYRAMIVPQVITNSSKLLSVTINGTEYVHATNIEFKPNTRHKITVTISAEDAPGKRLSVNFTIQEWQDDNVDYGGEMEKADKNKGRFAVTFADVTCGSATYTCTPVDNEMTYLLASTQVLGQYGVQGETPAEKMQAYLQMLAEYGMLTEEYLPYGYWFKGATTKEEIRFDAINVQVYAVGFQATVTGTDEYGYPITKASLITTVHAWDVPFLPYPSLVIAEADLNKTVASAAGTVAIDCVLENGVEGTEWGFESSAEWVSASWADNKLNLTYEANTAPFARKATIFVTYGDYTWFELAVTQEKDATAEDVTFQIEVVKPLFNGFVVNVTPSKKDVRYVLNTVTYDETANLAEEAENSIGRYGFTYCTGDVQNVLLKTNVSMYEWNGTDFNIIAFAVETKSEEKTDYYENVYVQETVLSVLSSVSSTGKQTVDIAKLPTLQWVTDGMTYNDAQQRYELEVVEGSTVTLSYVLTNAVEDGVVKVNGQQLYDSKNVVNGEPVVDQDACTVTFKIDAFDTKQKYGNYVEPTFIYTNTDGDNWNVTTQDLRLIHVQAQ